MLRVTVAPAIDDATLLPGWIGERNSRVGEQVPSFEGHEQWIEVEISGETYDYRVLVRPMRDGAPLEPASTVARCECNSEKLLELVDERIAVAIEQLQAAPSKEEATEPEPTTAPTPPPPERRRISGLGIGGIVVAGLGVSAIGGGAVMAAVGPRPVSDATSVERSWRFPGLITLGMGSAALAAGVSMLVVDVIQCRKPDPPSRCEARGKQSRLDVGPSFEANGGGVTVYGRF